MSKIIGREWNRMMGACPAAGSVSAPSVWGGTGQEHCRALEIMSGCLLVCMFLIKMSETDFLTARSVLTVRGNCPASSYLCVLATPQCWQIKVKSCSLSLCRSNCSDVYLCARLHTLGAPWCPDPESVPAGHHLLSHQVHGQILSSSCSPMQSKAHTSRI